MLAESVPPFLKVAVEMLEDSASFQLSTASLTSEPQGSN